MTSLQVTFGNLRSRDLISCHVTASCEIQLCRKSNIQYVSFWLSTATSRWLPVKWRHFRASLGNRRSRELHFLSRDCLFLRASLVGSEMCSICQFSDLYSYFQVTSGSLPVTWDHLTSFPVTWLPPPASYSLVVYEMYSVCLFSAFYSYFQVTSDQMTSLPDHIPPSEVTWRLSCHVTASCKLQLCRKSNVLYMSVFGILQPLPCDYQSNDINSGSVWVTWGHVMSFPVTWLPRPASYILVKSKVYSICEFSALYSLF